ncbi:MAG: N-acetylneuraminate synthase family protein [Candidatus Omnitrophica bacterium]|nr:N-acetylneuraminate synthase family protein [Candidatus Omnitrophota bacterium]
MKIGAHDTAIRPLIVAEIGNNHEGRFKVAQELVLAAASCGADAVKFQTFQAERFVSRADAARFQRLKGFELAPAQFTQLAELARSRGLIVLSTPLDLESAAFLEPLVDAFKIASGDNTFYPLIERVVRSGKPLIVSTGLSDTEQVRRTVEFIRTRQRTQGYSAAWALLHCVSSYPVEPAQANLRSIPFLAKTFGVPVGYSDHTVGIEAAVLAAALGAEIIEKHVTLDHDYSKFRDHQLSANPEQLQQLVRRVREVTAMLGRFDKRVQPCEQSATRQLRRSIAAAADLPVGAQLRWEDLVWLRPAAGLAPGEEGQLVGKVLKRAVGSGELIGLSDVEPTR